MYPENNGEVLPKLRLGREQNMEANHLRIHGLSKKCGQSETDMADEYAQTRIPTTVSFSDGRRLTGLRDLSTTTLSDAG